MAVSLGVGLSACSGDTAKDGQTDKNITENQICSDLVGKTVFLKPSEAMSNESLSISSTEDIEELKITDTSTATDGNYKHLTVDITIKGRSGSIKVTYQNFQEGWKYQGNIAEKEFSYPMSTEEAIPAPQEATQED